MQPPTYVPLNSRHGAVVIALSPLPRSEEHAPSADVLLAAESGGYEAAEAAAQVEVAEEAMAAEEERLAQAERSSQSPCGPLAAEEGLGEDTAVTRHPGAEIWVQLRQLLRCAEPYCHPSNHGPWSGLIGYFFQALAQYLSWRVLLESTGLAAPHIRPLAEDDVHVLLRMMLPLLSRSLYSKAGQLVLMSQMALRYLADLGPELVMPPMQLRLCEGLQAVTATHQTPMALQTLALLTPSLIDLSTAPLHQIQHDGSAKPVLPGRMLSAAARRAQATGPRAMLEALQLALPGIDANDLDKTSSALRFFAQVLLFLPIAGPRWLEAAPSETVPEAELEALGLMRRERTLAALKAAGDEESCVAMEEQEQEALALCSWLPDLAREMLSRLIATLEHFDKSSEGGREAMRQAMHLNQWRRTVSLFFQQLAEDVFDELLPSLVSLIRRPSLIDPIKHVGALLTAAANAYPARVLSRTLPICFDALLNVRKRGHDSALQADLGACELLPLSESELRWWLLVLSYLVRGCGAELLPYVPSLRRVLNLTAVHDEQKVVEASSKLRRRLLQALTSTYVTECRSLPPMVWRSNYVRAKPWRAWGWRPPLAPAAARVAAVNTVWHVPTDAELEVAASIVNATLERAESFASRLALGAPIVSGSSGGVSGAAGGAAKKAAPEAMSEDGLLDEASALGGSTGAAVTHDALRGCLFELRAVAKGAKPYLRDESARGAQAHAQSKESGPQIFPAPSYEEESLGGDDAMGDDAMEVDSTPSVPQRAGDKAPPVPRQNTMIAHAGKVRYPRATCEDPVTRLCNVLVSLGTSLAPREAVRHTVLLLQVSVSIVSEPNNGVHSEQQNLHTARRCCTLRGVGRPKFQPRSNLIAKISLRHSARLSSSNYGAAWRTPALKGLISMQLDLSTHPYSNVRTEAQVGFCAALRMHPWLARAHLPTQIEFLRSPSAEPHQTKGAIFMLSTRGSLKRAAAVSLHASKRWTVVSCTRCRLRPRQPAFPPPPFFGSRWSRR